MTSQEFAAAFTAPVKADHGSGYTTYVTCVSCKRDLMLSGAMAHLLACRNVAQQVLRKAA